MEIILKPTGNIRLDSRRKHFLNIFNNVISNVLADIRNLMPINMHDIYWITDLLKLRFTFTQKGN